MNRRHRKNPQPDDTVWLYGLHAVAAALTNPDRQVRQVLVTKNARRTLAAAAKLPGAIREASPQQIAKLLPPDAVHQGCAAEVVPLTQPELEDLLASSSKDSLYVVLDQVTDPRNVGAILRSCAALGASAVIAQRRHSPGETGALAKAASGALEYVPYVQIANLARGLNLLAESNCEILGLADDAEDLLGPTRRSGPCAIVLGAEGPGLRQLTQQKCNRLVRLATNSTMPSLNVSNAAAIALYMLTVTPDA